MKFSLFIPAYNEEAILERNVQKLINFLRSCSFDFELIIHDDGSTDDTPVIGQRLAKKYQEVMYLSSNGPSRREDLALAFRHARGEIVAFEDADLSPSIYAIPKLVDAIQQGFDIVIASKYIRGSRIRKSLYRFIISKMYNWFARLFFGSKITDHAVGLKAWKKRVLWNLLGEMGYDHSFTRGLFWDVEMLVRAQRAGLKIKEIPIVWIESPRTCVRVRREIKMIPYAIAFKWRLRAHK